MAISEAARSDLYNGLCDAIGPERAETLMSAMPLHDLDEVVTKADLRAEIAEVRAGLARLEAKIDAQQANLNTKIEAQQAAMYKHVNRLVGTVLVSIVGAVLGVGLLS